MDRPTREEAEWTEEREYIKRCVSKADSRGKCGAYPRTTSAKELPWPTSTPAGSDDAVPADQLRRTELETPASSRRCSQSRLRYEDLPRSARLEGKKAVITGG